MRELDMIRVVRRPICKEKKLSSEMAKQCAVQISAVHPSHSAVLTAVIPALCDWTMAATLLSIGFDVECVE